MNASTARFAALLLAALSVPSLFAQPRVELRVDAVEVYVNEPVRVKIEVRNFKTCDPPVFPEIPGCDVRFVGTPPDSSFKSTVNGRVVEEWRVRTFVYELTPTSAGELVIPPVPVKVDGTTLETRESRLRILPSDAEDLLAVEIRSVRERIYVGQRVPLTLAVWIKPAVVGRRRLDVNEMFRAGLDFTRSNLGPFRRDSKFRGEQRDWTTSDGSRAKYYVYEIDTDWVADRPGPLSFDDVQIVMQYPTAFGRDFLQRLVVTKTRTLRARAKVAATEVLLPPAEGRPDNFTGAVGTYDIVTSATPATVRVGDPIELTILISGDGPLETLPPPRLASNPRLTESFQVPSEALAGEFVARRRRYTQNIRAKRANVTEIPPIEYAYFDPYRERYAVARSKPIPLRITAVENLDTSELTESDTTDRPTARGAADAFVGLLGNETGEAVLLKTTPPVQMTAVIIATAMPPAMFFGAWGCLAYVQRRGDDVGRRRRAAALRNARRRIENARAQPPRERSHEISAAMAAYLADRLNEPPARFAGRAGLELLQQRGVSPAAQQLWTEAVERCEQASYGGADTDADAVADAARDCLRLLERERL